MTSDDVFFYLLSSLQPVELTSELLEQAYCSSYFPMADENGCIAWHSPDPRAIFPLETWRVPKSLRKVIASGLYHVTVDTAFEEVVRACSRRDKVRPEEVWISEEILTAYTDLHREGNAHSVETWIGDRLVGGLYGVSFGAAFFGESMFSHESNASKVAFAALVERLRHHGYTLLDSQYANAYTLQLGAVEVSRERYLAMLAAALERKCGFHEE
ncbi:MAG: leucyl/phenylalanyl-tRNA--protein transferase [Candidatus Kapaibacterium sp.]